MLLHNNVLRRHAATGLTNERLNEKLAGYGM